MIRLLLASAVGVAVGYFVLPKAVSAVSGAPDATAQRAAGQAPAARMAQDIRYMCRQLDPMLANLEQSLADRSLSTSEALRLYSQVQRLL